MRAMRAEENRILPIFRKTGPLIAGAAAFTRARDLEQMVDELPRLLAIEEAAQEFVDLLDPADDPPVLDALRAALVVGQHRQGGGE